MRELPFCCHPTSPRLRKPFNMSPVLTLSSTGEALLDASDPVLALAVAGGDRAALGEVYRRHGGPTFRLAQRLLHDDRLAEEVVQDVIVGFWQTPQRFDPERGQLRSFLLMKTHGRAVDVLRAEQSRRRRDQLDSDDRHSVTYDLERHVLDLDLAERVTRALDRLPDSERRAITLAYFGGHTYREVAELLEEPEGTIKSRIRSGLKALRRQLDLSDSASLFGQSSEETISHEGVRT
jgi:RNA polymerase sigma-70 factor, ECF subfamily